MSNFKITEQVKNQFLTKAFLVSDRLSEARELIESHPDLKSNWRELALKYSDSDDLENALFAFRRSYESGDRRSLPWLLELLVQYRPDDNLISSLREEQSAYLDQMDTDVFFSLGNMALVAGNFAEAYRLWEPFVGRNLWIFDRNLYSNLLHNPDETISIASREFGHITNQQEIISALVDLHVSHWLKEADAVDSLIGLLTYPPFMREVEKFSSFRLENLFDVALSHANLGDPWPLYMSSLLANQYGIEAPRINAFVEDSGLMTILKEANLFAVTSEKAQSPSTAGLQSHSVPGNRVNELQDIFDRATAAQNSGDTQGEIAAWIDGAKLGDANCFYNIGVTIGKELGIVCNYFGCSGGKDEFWGEIAKGIQMDDIRAMENKINYLEEHLLEPILTKYRKQFGVRELNSTSSLTAGSLSNMPKLKDFLEFNGLEFFLLSETVLALPYVSGKESLINFVELVKDGEEELFLIHSPLMTTRVGADGNFIARHSPITQLEQKLLRIVIRSKQLILPNTGIWLGDIFMSIPEEKRPNIFLNKMQSSEIWRFFGDSKDGLVEPIPTRDEFTQINFGYAVDASLVSDHFDTAVRGALGAIIDVVTTLRELQQESFELFELIFDHDAATPNQIDSVGLTISEQLKVGVNIAQIDKALFDLRERTDIALLNSLEAKGVKLASRIVTLVELNKKNVGFASETLLRIAKDYEYDLDIRNALNNAGWIYDQEFQDDAMGLTLFQEAVRLGSANAMSNLSWRLMLQERFREAVEIYEKNYYRLMTTRTIPEDFSQAANFRSNVALCRWALGASKEELNEIWMDEYLQGRHAESLFYPSLFEFISGDVESAISSVTSLEKNIQLDLREAFEEGRKNRGWFGETSRRALELLDKASPGRGIFG